MTIKADRKSSLLTRVAAWWRSRRSPHADSLRVSNQETARDVGSNEPKSRPLAGKWPGAGDPLARMLEQLKRGS
jgi:hypothetical protein